MTSVLIPPVVVSARLRPVRLALAATLVLPMYVVWGGADAHVELRLRLAGAAVAVMLGLVWDDISAPLTGSTPMGLPAVQRGRVVLVAALLAVAWSSAALAAVHTTDGVPIGPSALEAIGLSLVVCAATGALARGRSGESVTAFPALLLLALLLLQSRAPQGWQLISAGPESAAVRERWTILIAVALVMLTWSSRDPAHRRRQPSA